MLTHRPLAVCLLLTLTGVLATFPLSRAETVIKYAFARIEQRSYLLPATSENIGCMRGSGTCSRNAIVFRNYRKFEAESVVTFDKFAGM